MITSQTKLKVSRYQSLGSTSKCGSQPRWVACLLIEQCSEVRVPLSMVALAWSNVPSKSMLSVRGMKGCVSSGEYYLRQGNFGSLFQNARVL